MPGITNPAEEYFKDGLWGWASTLWEKLVSSGGRLFTALHGWDGDSWQKLPMLWGYSDVWRDAKSATDVTAGDDVITFTVVDTGEVVVITNFCLRCSQANADRVELRAYVDGLAILLRSRATLVAWDSIDVQCNVVLNVDDYLAFYYKGASAGDDFYAYACGYKMEVAE